MSYGFPILIICLGILNHLTQFSSFWILISMFITAKPSTMNVSSNWFQEFLPASFKLATLGMGIHVLEMAESRAEGFFVSFELASLLIRNVKFIALPTGLFLWLFFLEYRSASASPSLKRFRILIFAVSCLQVLHAVDFVWVVVESHLFGLWCWCFQLLTLIYRCWSSFASRSPSIQGLFKFSSILLLI